MATYAIGDIQGCYDELMRLLDEINFNADKDKLWFTGDLVNRGPKSLKTLRFIRSLEENAVAVLGNHDLHLLATAFHHKTPGKKDTLDKVEDVLQSDKHIKFYKHMYGNKPSMWSDDLDGWSRLRYITNIFTRIRFCTPTGKISLACKREPGKQPQGYQPWFSIEHRASRHTPIIFGHWYFAKISSIQMFTHWIRAASGVVTLQLCKLIWRLTINLVLNARIQLKKSGCQSPADTRFSCIEETCNPIA